VPVLDIAELMLISDSRTRHDAPAYHLATLEEQPEPLQDQVLHWASPTHAVWGGIALPTKWASLFQKHVTEGSLYVHF
jgi:hypothetical protein